MPLRVHAVAAVVHYTLRHDFDFVCRGRPSENEPLPGFESNDDDDDDGEEEEEEETRE